ncbi:MAG: hypothetical protein OEX07_14145, partial [Gammaproteobacteria bacterium]|nr:hypothetical protein [Gammaproteobacteria bacterium]
MKNNVIIRYVFFVSFSLFHVLQADCAESTISKSSSSSPEKSLSEKSPAKEALVLQSKIHDISRSLKLKERRKNKIQKTIYFSDAKIEKLGKSLLEIKNRQLLAQTRLSGLEEEKRYLLVSIETSSESVSELMRAFYLLQKQGSLKVMLNQEDAGKAGRLKIYHDYLINAYLDQYRVLNDQYRDLELLNKSLSSRLSSLEKLENKNKQQTLELEESYKNRQIELEKLLNQISADESKVDSLKSDQRRLEELAKAIAKLKTTQSSGMSFAKH